MLTHGGLISAFSTAHNIPVATVIGNYRLLRESGCVEIKGRGRSAAHKSLDDLVWLTIISMIPGPLSSSERFKKAEYFANLPPSPEEYPSGVFVHDTFFDAVKGVISDPSWSAGSYLRISTSHHSAYVSYIESRRVVDIVWYVDMDALRSSGVTAIAQHIEIKTQKLGDIARSILAEEEVVV